jgi:hypothetical protein
MRGSVGGFVPCRKGSEAVGDYLGRGEMGNEWTSLLESNRPPTDGGR